MNTDLSFSNNNAIGSIKEEFLKQKFSEINTGGVGTSTVIKNPVLYDPEKPLFTFEQGFDTLDEIDGKYLMNYVHLCEMVEFTSVDERRFKILYKEFMKRRIKKRQSRSLNKLGEFDLTKEIRERKRHEWWAKLKYRLLKLINTKHSLIRAFRQPLPKEVIEDSYFKPLFSESKRLKNQKSMNTEPDILSLLEQFRLYYEKKSIKKEKSEPVLSKKSICKDESNNPIVQNLN
jgi:hypothetical protein